MDSLWLQTCVRAIIVALPYSRRNVCAKGVNCAAHSSPGPAGRRYWLERTRQYRFVAYSSSDGHGQIMFVQEGTNSHGDAYRSLMDVFKGKGGPTLLSIEDPTSRWNQAEVDAFIASIR